MTTPITFADATTPTDAPTYRTQALATLAAPAPPLQPAPVAGWSQNAPQRLLVEEFATEMAAESSLRVKVASTVSPATAAAAGASWVEACIGWFDEDYIPAIAAAWDVTFVCALSSAPLTVGPSANTVIQIQATTGQIFVLAQATDRVFNGSNHLQLRFVARIAGTAGDATSSAIYTGKILTGPAGLSMLAASPFTAARDIETPQQAITRCLGKWARLGVGWTSRAFDYLVPFYSPTVTRWIVDDANPLGPGSLTIALANSTGPATDQEVALVQAGLTSLSGRPFSSGKLTAKKALADALTVNVTITGDGSNAGLDAQAHAAALLFANAFPLGQATLDDGVLKAILLGASYTDSSGNPTPIKIATATGFTSITVPGLGFGGAVAIASIDLVAPHVVPAGRVLQLTINVTVA